MLVLVNAGIFGGNAYSTRGGRLARMIGRREIRTVEVRIARPKGKVRMPQGHIRNVAGPPWIPESITKELYPGGNSVCYQIQIAHLMGCSPIYLAAFTLQSGSGYFFGRDNPVRRKPSFYDAEPVLHWLEWYEKSFPGRARLLPGWDGPIYGTLPTEEADDYRRTLEAQSVGRAGHAESGARASEPDAEA